MVKLDKLILGSNAFEGVSYISRTQSSYYLEYFSKAENIVSILEAAFNLEIKTFMCSNGENILSALNSFKNKKEISLLPIIPNAYEYAREASEKGVLGTIMNKAKRISMYQKVRFGLRAAAKIKSVISKDILNLLLELIDFELASFHRFNIMGVVLHGQITDLALSSHNRDIIDIFQNLIKETYGIQPILATHNLGTLLPQLIKWNIKIPVMAPFNQKGFMMRPSQEECEKLLQETDYCIIAKKVLAGGRLSPEEAFKYLTDKKIDSVVIGIGTVSEAYHTFSVAKSALKI